MRRFELVELSLLSHMEKRARRFSFDPRTTTIVGTNDTGKSSVIKSIYTTFGAEPALIDPTWRTTGIISVLRFTLDGVRYTALRSSDTHYAIFDSEDRVIGTFSRITSDLAPFLAELFGFRITLPDREGKLITPPPAHLFAPFYIDQDIGWTKTWSSFAKLQQLPSDWRREVAEYHAGVRPNQYYVLRAEIQKLKQESVELRAESTALSTARERVRAEFPAMDFSIDMDEFRDEIKLLLVEVERLRDIEVAYKNKLIGMQNQKHILDEQIAITAAALKELRADYEFAAHRLADTVDCPICGASYDNDFAERFAIAADENRLNEMLTELATDAHKLDESIRALNEKYSDAGGESREAERLLGSRRGEVTLHAIIQAEGQKEVTRVLTSNIDSHIKQVVDLDRSIAVRENDLKATDDEDRQSEIREFYATTAREFMQELDIRPTRESDYRSMWSQVSSQTGSDRPRALLAVYFAYLHTVQRFTTATFCPIVIDEPNQQGQDKYNLPKMIEFIFSHQPRESQLVVGLESLHGVTQTGALIELTEKNRVLRGDAYDDVAGELEPLLRKSYLAANDKAIQRTLFSE